MGALFLGVVNRGMYMRARSCTAKLLWAERNIESHVTAKGHKSPTLRFEGSLILKAVDQAQERLHSVSYRASTIDAMKPEGKMPVERS